MSLSQLTDAYLAGARALRQTVAGMSRDQSRAHPVPGKWSAVQLACHLADIDAIDADRMKRVIAEDRPTLIDADQDRFAAALAYHERDLEEEVFLVEHTRRQMARILRTLPDSALARAADYRIGGRVEERTLEQLLNKTIRHFAHHLPFLLAKRKALGLPDQPAGPAIVPAVSDDQLRLARDLFNEYADFLRDVHGEICFRDFEAETASLPGAYGPPEGRLLLALDGTDVAGCVALRPLAGGDCEMKRLFVRPAFRGRGVGRELARAVIAEARGIGYARMRLDTLPAMTGALALYRSLGFAETGPYSARPTSGALYLELPLR